MSWEDQTIPMNWEDQTIPRNWEGQTIPKNQKWRIRGKILQILMLKFRNIGSVFYIENQFQLNLPKGLGIADAETKKRDTKANDFIFTS